jgi:uncharacterized protein YbaA (DUF1428 family)
MPQYVEGFVLPVGAKNLPAYRRLARKASRIWRDHGALEYRECVGDDLDVQCGKPFPEAIRTRRGEMVMFSWIVYASRRDRDRVTAKVMKDPRTAAMCQAKDKPFDPKRMLYGGFKTLVKS